jgi:hypothetical protein
MKKSLVAGSLTMIQPAWHHISGSEDHQEGELYQTSLMAALMAGLYEGEMTYGEIREHGDFGLGTFNDLDGEMVGFDGTFYQLRSDGSLVPSRPTKRRLSLWLPFSSRSRSWMWHSR